MDSCSGDRVTALAGIREALRLLLAEAERGLAELRGVRGDVRVIRRYVTGEGRDVDSDDRAVHSAVR